MKTEKHGTATQGVEVQNEENKKQKVSVTYTLRAFGENVKKLYELGLLTREEATEGVRLVAIARNKYLGAELTLD